MATRVLIPAAACKAYAEQKRGVEEALLTGQRRGKVAMVLTYFETGRMVNEHVLLNAARTGYAEGIIPRLEKRSGVSQRLLYQCAQFNRRLPILHRGAKLGWSHYRLLCQIEDDAKRASLAAETARRGWTAPELEGRVRRFNLESAQAIENGESTTPASPQKFDRLTPKRGTPGLHPVVARREGLAVDLGFKMYLLLAPEEVRRLKFVAGSIVRTDGDGQLVRDDAATKADLFTYRALAVRVVDGDTLAVTVDLPPHNEADKKLRLRGIDCPEMDTPEGKAAKRFVQGLVDQAKSVLLTTTKPDKYDRYLADVFLELDEDPDSQLQAAPKRSEGGSALNSQLPDAPIFLNNILLENGHAVRMDGSTPKEWE
jgi:endonuclease YncB( thermonuclease family)